MNGSFPENPMRPLFRNALSLLAFGALAALPARADWPEHAVKWVVPFAPGGANDLIARAAAEGVSKRIGQPVVIEYKAGAGAAIGAD
jgi:tripartite-type tricarboxylate transporter receptor subunit TctC